MNIVALDSSDWVKSHDNGVAREDAVRCVTKAAEEVELLLRLPENYNITLRPTFHHVMREYGVGGYAHDTELLDITFDPEIPFGSEAFYKFVRETVYHELNHIYRYQFTEPVDDLLSGVVMEGLATVFERELSGANPPYGEYSDAPVGEWLAELKQSNYDGYSDYFFSHPDGRKWIGYKTGTWIVDEAIKKSGKDVIELSVMDYKVIIELAKVTSNAS